MFEPVARVLAFFYSLPVVGGSYGFAIILLTAAVMIVLMPLTLKATRSQIKMQEIQPKLKALQKKHKDDKTTLNSELMALYQEQGINPVGSCLPMIAQLPVFLVLFNVLRGLSRRVSETPFFAIADHARIEAGSAAIPSETFDPKYLSPDSQMYIDLSRDQEMAFGPFDLAQEALDVLQSDFLRGLPYVVLILFVVGTSFYQQRQVTARRSNGSVGMNPQQEMILKFLPLLSGIWSFVFPAGLVVYWATSNTFRIAQQTYITRAFYGDRATAVLTGDGSDDDDDSGGDRDTGVDDDDGGERAKAKGSKGSKGGGGPSKSKAKQGKKPQSAKASSSSNGESADRDSAENGSGSDEVVPADRQEAWAKRRRDNARVQEANRTRRDNSSRVTPKGTKPSGPKKKRKR